MSLLLIGLITFVVSLIAFFGSLLFFPRFGLIDRPEKYGLNRKPIPYPGGIVIFLVFLLLTIVFFVPLSAKLVGVLLGASLLVSVSFLDDRYELPVLFRLIMQFISVIIVVISGVGIEGIANPLGGFIPLNEYKTSFSLFHFPFEIVWLADIVVVLWLVMLINTMNWLDGVHGLSSGVATIGFLVLLLLGLRPGHVIDQSQVISLSFVLVIISSTFLLFNFPPAKILLGDSGSMFFGFMLGVLSIFAGAKLATTFLIMGVPIFDLVWVVLRRVFVEKRSPAQGDLKHFHHRLLSAGLSQRRAVLLIYALCAAFGGIALFLNSFSKMIAIIVLVFVMFVAAALIIKKE